MKKSLRIFSLVLAVVMIFGSVSIAASAWDANGHTTYRSQTGAGLTFDDVNDPVYSVDQYASMALDELDRMLAKADISVYIYIGTLDLKSIDGTIASVKSLYASVGQLLTLGLLDDASMLDISAVNNTKRSNGDITVLWDLLDLIGDLNPILKKYVSGSFSLGIMNSFVADYVFNVRELVFGLLYGLTGMGGDDYDYFETREIPAKYQGNGTALIFAQDVLNTLVIGKWQKLDDLFYNKTTNKSSNVVYSEYEFHNGSAAGANVSNEAMDTAHYDYYGYVHPDRWVTFGLGDAIRVAEGAGDPTNGNGSYTKVNITANTATYNFVEPLLLHAYNNLLVPVLNRITKNWLREKAGYTFDEKYTTLYKKDLSIYRDVDKSKGSPAYNDFYDQNDDPIINPDYDYLYEGQAPESGDANYSDKIFEIFDVESLVVPKYVIYNNHLFFDDFNRNAINFARKILKADVTLNGAAVTDANYNPQDGNVYKFTWTSDDGTKSYDFDATFGGNTFLTDNICNAVRFILQVTEDEFFSDILINKGELKTPADLEILDNQELVSYIIRSVINSSVDYMWIEENELTRTVVGAAYEAVVQLAYQDIPQFIYTAPASGSPASAYVNKALAILMDVAAYNLNANLDTNFASASVPYSKTNNGSVNNTGLLGYLGDGGNYATSAITIASWAISKWVNTSYAGTTDLLNVPSIDFTKYNNGGTTLTENAVWSDLDYLLNAIIPIKTVPGASTANPDNRPWLPTSVAGTDGSKLVVKDFLFDTVVDSLCNLDFDPIIAILDRNTNGALAYDSIEVAIVDTLHRIFDLIFPDVFANTVNSIDALLNNSLLASMVSDLAVTLSATRTSNSYQNYATTNGSVITGRGKMIAEFALPIVCMILGLSDTQEFGQLENYVPERIPASDTSTSFYVYNGSSGVNTSYINPDTGLRVVDQLYTYTVTSASVNIVSGPSSQVQFVGLVEGTTIPAGERIECTASGYTAGQVLEFIIKYRVSDENGNDLGNELSNSTYAYVGNEGDDTARITLATLGGDVITGPKDIYVTGGLSSVEGYGLTVKDDKSANNITVQSVAVLSNPDNANNYYNNNGWVTISPDNDDISAAMSGNEATYVLFPFEVLDNVGRVQYEYQTDENNAYVLDEQNMRIKTGVKAPENNDEYVADGEYVIRTVVSNGSTTANIDTRVHVFDDYGLPSLVDNAINANRSTSTLTEDGKGYFNAYYTALMNAVGFVRQPHSHGGSFETWIASTNYDNKYEQYYRALYTQIETIKPFEASSGAASIFTAVNAKWPYDFSRQSAVFTDGTTSVTAYYRDYKEYNESGYPYIGQRNYMGFTYKKFKNAVSEANSLIDREYKYIGFTPEEFEKLSTADKTAAIENYNKAIDNISVISSIDSAMAIHMVNLQFSRLIELGAGDRSKLQIVLDSEIGTTSTTSGYSTSSKNAYNTAKSFATSVAGDSEANPEKITTALNKLVYTWKHLEAAADYTAAKAALNLEKQWIVANVGGWGLTGNSASGNINLAGADEQTTYTSESYLAYLEKLLALSQLIATEGTDDELGVGDQSRLDDAVGAVNTAKAALSTGSGSGEGGDATCTFVGDAITNYTYKYIAEFSPLIDELVLSSMLYETIEESVYGLDISGEQEVDYYGTPINGAIYGLPEGPQDYDVEALFELENCTLVVTLTEEGMIGTGSYAIILDDATGEVLYCYMIIVRGDVNGDGEVNASDDAYYLNCLSEIEGFTYGDYYSANRYRWLGMDIDGDTFGDGTDWAMYDIYTSGEQDILMDLGGLTELDY